MPHRHHEFSDEQKCYICGKPAMQQCDRCHRDICLLHKHTRMRFHWETVWTTADWYGIRYHWRRYVPEGEERHLCPACLEEIEAQDAQEFAKDRHEQRLRQIAFGFLLAGLITVNLVAAFLWTTHRMPIIK